MTLFFKHVASSLSSPITATPNALAFSTPSATQVANFPIPASDPKILPPSPSSIMTSGSGPRNKRKRFPGWLCEDEISETETALFEKLDAQGRDYNSVPLASKTRQRVGPNITSAGAPESPSSSADGRTFNLRQRANSNLSLREISPSSRSKPQANANLRQTKTKLSRPGQKRVLRQSKRIPGISSKDSLHKVTRAGGFKEEVSRPLKNEIRQPPKKKPRFHGYVCEDEAAEDNPALAKMIRQKGTPFQLRKTILPETMTVNSPSANRRPVQKDISVPKTEKSTIPDHPSPRESRLKITGVKQSKVRHQAPPISTARSKPSDEKAKPRRKTSSSQDQPQTTKSKNLFPNLSSDLQVAPSSTTLTPPVSDKDSTRMTPVARAQQFVKASTSDFKHLSALSDKAARAAAAAKRKARDAANRLEEAKRSLRVESEKEKARSEGRRFAFGWAWVEDDENDQASANSRRRRNRSGNHADTEKAATLGHRQAIWRKDAPQADLMAETQDDQDEFEEENDKNVEDEEQEDEDEDEEDDEYESTTDDEGDIGDDTDTSDDDDGDIKIGQTADLLG